MKIKKGTILLLLPVVLILAGITGYGSSRIVTAMVDQKVAIPDPVLENAIRESLDIYGRDIRASDMARINKLHIVSQKGYSGQLIKHPVTDLTGLEYCINAEEIWLGGHEITDFTPVSNIDKLQLLDISGSEIQDISFLKNLVNLRHLSPVSYTHLTLPTKRIV